MKVSCLHANDLELLDPLFVLIEPKDSEKMYIRSFVKEYGLSAFLLFLDVFDFSTETFNRLSSVSNILIKGSEQG